MPRSAARVPVTCADCAAAFTLTPAAHARRVARYGQRLLCQRCLGDVWLRTWRGTVMTDRLLRDAAPSSDGTVPTSRPLTGATSRP